MSTPVEGRDDSSEEEEAKALLNEADKVNKKVNLEAAEVVSAAATEEMKEEKGRTSNLSII
jgi:phosphoribosyl-ATP pyrophosphohydrolase